jgi:signal transduction histidine kinase
MGIGLSISRTIVEAHDGWVTLANAERGAVLTIALPRATARTGLVAGGAAALRA